MKNKLIVLFILNISLIFSQSYINYDLSNQFGVALDNNEIIWDKEKKFDDLLIDRSTTYFDNKFLSFDFASMPSDSLYVKSKFQYEFGDYGFDKLNIGLRKQSSISNFEFIAMKKSFFGTYSEFANKDSSPLSLFYKIDYNTILSKHNFYLSTGYFREDSKFLFNNESLIDNSMNIEFSDFLSITVGDSFIANRWDYNIELNHISKSDERSIAEYVVAQDIDIEKNRLNVSANNKKNIFLKSFIDNTYYFDHSTQRGYSRNILQLSNSNQFPFGNFTYGIDYISDKVVPAINYEAVFGVVQLSVSRKNKSNMILFDKEQFGEMFYSFSDDEEIQNWDSLVLSYGIDRKISFNSNLKFISATNLEGYDLSTIETPGLNGYFSFSDDMLSLETRIGVPTKRNKIDIIHYHNFYDSLISSNRSDMLDVNYYFNTSFVDQKLAIDGKLFFRYLSKNESGYSFDYFRNMPTSNSVHYDESYNIGLDLNISIADVLLIVKLKNGLDRLPLDGDYSINNHALFNPMKSFLSFGIVWEFDD